MLRSPGIWLPLRLLPRTGPTGPGQAVERQLTAIAPVLLRRSRPLCYTGPSAQTGVSTAAAAADARAAGAARVARAAGAAAAASADSTGPGQDGRAPDALHSICRPVETRAGEVATGRYVSPAETEPAVGPPTLGLTDRYGTARADRADSVDRADRTDSVGPILLSVTSRQIATTPVRRSRPVWQNAASQ